MGVRFPPSTFAKIMGLPDGQGKALAMPCLGIVTPQVHQVSTCFALLKMGSGRLDDANH